MRAYVLLFVASSACAAYVPRVQRTAPPRARAAACAPGTASEISDAWFKVAVDTSAAADGAASAPLDDVRASAAAQLSGLSFPGRKIEAWRRTDLSSLASAQLVAPQSMDVESMVADSATEATDGARLVLVDGVCNAALSDLSALPSGVSIGSLLNAGGDAEASVRAALRAPLPEAEADVRTALGSYTFAALNQASLRDVAYIHVPPEVSVDIPIHVLYLSSGADAAAEGAQAPTEIAASHPSLIVSVGTNASVHVLQQYRGSGSYWTNALTRILLDEDSTIQHSYVQEQAVSAVHLDSIQVEAAAGACYENALLQSGGRIGRINQLVNLNGPGARSELRGLALATGNQVSDLHSFVRHVSPDCTSDQEQRNAVAGRGRVVFRGAVLVPRGADNTTAAQLCRTLLLSDDARCDIQPTLEIDTDEVVCTHGATVSDLDDEMIFYLQSRGLSRVQARSLLLAGWARDALAQVPSDSAKERAADKAATLAPEERRRSVRREGLMSI